MKLFNNKKLWRKNKKILTVLAITVCLSMVIVNLQGNLIKVSAQIIPVTVSTNHLSFGAVFPGEQVQGGFVVSYAEEEGDGIDYRIIQKRKPLPPEHPEYPNGGDPEMPGYYRDLCPYLTKVSQEGEGDIENDAFVGPEDISDNWTIYFEVPAIFGYVAQDHTGGVVDINGEYGCDISIDIEEPITSINGGGGGSGGGGGGGSGGGGGGGSTPLAIYDEQVSCLSETSVIVTWRTNQYTTGRVVYDMESHPSIGPPPNYGYANSIATSADKVTIHSMAIENLAKNTIYYFKPISGVFPDVFGKELSFDTSICYGTIVLGEEGAPELTINKTVNAYFANPGDTVAYKINITNNGNLTVYNAVLTDILPSGFTFSDGGSATKTWALGDIEPGQIKTVEYNVAVSDSAAAGIYANLARVSADNHGPITDSTDLEVRKVKILAAELYGTGFSMKEFIILILALVILSGSAAILRKKYLA